MGQLSYFLVLHCPIFCFEYIDMGREVIWSSSFWYHGCIGNFMVWNLCNFGESLCKVSYYYDNIFWYDESRQQDPWLLIGIVLFPLLFHVFCSLYLTSF